MTDPPRLRDLPDGDAWTRQLLRDAPKSSALTPADYARLGDRVPQTLASAGVGAATALPLKALALLGAIGLGAAGAVALRPRSPSPPAAHTTTAPTPRAHAPAPTAESTTPPPPVLPDTAGPPEPTAPVAAPAPVVRPPPQRARVVARPTPPQTTPEAAPEPTLAQELQVLDAARAQMRTDPSGAAALLRDATGTQLRDERDALRAESLARAGRLDEARAVARTLTARAPHSPQSARVRSLLGESP